MICQQANIAEDLFYNKWLHYYLHQTVNVDMLTSVQSSLWSAVGLHHGGSRARLLGVPHAEGVPSPWVCLPKES
jgi:hypothetical protein